MYGHHVLILINSGEAAAADDTASVRPRSTHLASTSK